MNPVFFQGYYNPSIPPFQPNIYFNYPINQPCIIQLSNQNTILNVNPEECKIQDKIKNKSGEKKIHKSMKSHKPGNNSIDRNKERLISPKNPGRWSSLEHQIFIQGSLIKDYLFMGKIGLKLNRWFVIGLAHKYVVMHKNFFIKYTKNLEMLILLKL